MNIAQQIAQESGVSEAVVLEAAESCARRLVDWCGGEAEAIRELIGEFAGDLAAAAMDDHLKAHRRFAVSCHNDKSGAARAVHQILKNRE